MPLHRTPIYRRSLWLKRTVRSCRGLGSRRLRASRHLAASTNTWLCSFPFPPTLRASNKSDEGPYGRSKGGERFCNVCIMCRTGKQKLKENTPGADQAFMVLVASAGIGWSDTFPSFPSTNKQGATITTTAAQTLHNCGCNFSALSTRMSIPPKMRRLIALCAHAGQEIGIKYTFVRFTICASSFKTPNSSGNHWYLETDAPEDQRQGPTSNKVGQDATRRQSRHSNCASSNSTKLLYPNRVNHTFTPPRRGSLARHERRIFSKAHDLMNTQRIDTSARHEGNSHHVRTRSPTLWVILRVAMAAPLPRGPATRGRKIDLDSMHCSSCRG